MKKTILILGITAAAILAGCTKNEMEVNVDKTFNGDKAYFVVNINDVGTSSTRATSGANGYDFLYGSSAEYAIYDANFFFYASDGSFVAEAEVTNPSGSNHNATTDDNGFVQDAVEYDVYTVVTLTGLTDKSYPNWVVTVLNKPDGFTAPSTLDEFAGLLADASAEGITVDHDNTTYYTMSTASYYNDKGYPSDSPTIWFATPVVDSNFSLEDLSGDGETGYKDADGNDIDPIDIYVERLAAKVYLSTSMSGNSDGYYEITNEVVDENGVDTETTLYVKFDGWLLNATAKYSNLMKTIQSTTTWSDEYFYPTGANEGTYQTWGDDWNDASNYRSYWGESFNYGLGQASDYPDSSAGNTDAAETTSPLNDYLLYTSLYGEGVSLNTINSTYQYCAENTNTAGKMNSGYIIDNKMSSAITSILVAATIYQYNDGEYTAVEDMVRCDGALYTVDNYLKYALSHIGAYYIKTTVDADNQSDYPDAQIGDEVYSKITTDDVQLVNTNDGYVSVALASKYTDSTDNNYVGEDFVFYNSDGTATYNVTAVSEALDSFNENYGSDANYYNGGKMYYSIPIEHLNNDYDETYTDNGVEYPWVLEGNYGIVRNHIYYVDITKVENLGHGIYDPDEVIVPQPEIPTYSLAADIHILSWKIVNQSVEL